MSECETITIFKNQEHHDLHFLHSQQNKQIQKEKVFSSNFLLPPSIKFFIHLNKLESNLLF